MQSVIEMKPVEVKPKRSGTIADQYAGSVGGTGRRPDRDGLIRTPEHGGEALKYLTSGYKADLNQIVNGALFQVKYDEDGHRARH